MAFIRYPYITAIALTTLCLMGCTSHPPVDHQQKLMAQNQELQHRVIELHAENERLKARLAALEVQQHNPK